MRIISKFRDYYDCIQGMGVDLSNTYIRKCVNIDVHKDDFPMMPTLRTYTFTEIRPIRIGFCGKFYAVIKTIVRDERTYKETAKFFYDFESFDAYHEKFHKGLAYYRNTAWYREFFDLDMSKYEELFFEHKVPIFAFRYCDDDRKFVLQLNPCLRDLSFQHHVDPYTAFQEIAMYRSGVLGCMEADTVNISDEDMKKQKGFGHKYAFKKEPE